MTKKRKFPFDEMILLQTRFSCRRDAWVGGAVYHQPDRHSRDLLSGNLLKRTGLVKQDENP
ncbi:MAG: hypothetical protein ABFD12_11280 [Syntrophorhabdus sp.]